MKDPSTPPASQGEWWLCTDVATFQPMLLNGSTPTEQRAKVLLLLGSSKGESRTLSQAWHK